MIAYPYEQPVASERFVVGYRNYAGGGVSWPVLDSLEAADAFLVEKQAEKAAELASHPGGSRAHIPVSWYIERLTHIRRVELVSETLVSEMSP